MLKSVSPDVSRPTGVVAVADQQPRLLPLPLLPIRATCGFPSPAEDFYGAQDTLDISQRLVTNPAVTFDP
jgi:DNA polymerase V